jgi:hypothetical protein
MKLKRTFNYESLGPVEKSLLLQMLKMLPPIQFDIANALEAVFPLYSHIV